MSGLRRLLVLATFALAGALAPSLASAARPAGLPETLTSEHFVVHYFGEPGVDGAIVHQTAADLGGTAEQAYDKLLAWGFPPPYDDGDGHVDIYVQDLPLEYAGLAWPESAANQTAGWIELDYEYATDAETIAHELFHLVQFGLWAPADPWLLEATAEWNAFRFVDFPARVVTSLGAPDMSLSCTGPACGYDDYERGGYSRWSFFEYLNERYGGTIVRDVFEWGAIGGDPAVPAIDLVSSALSTRGITLADAFTGWTVANLSGDYTAPGLKGIVPPTHSRTITGTADGTLAPQRVSVNHLAARFVGLERGDGAGGATCYAATLNVSVALPAGIGARPYFFWTGGGGKAVPLAVSGNTASISVPWDTCSWEKGEGLLALPNPSTTADAQVFTVTGSLAVDEKTIATASAPPTSTDTRPTVPAPTADPPPAISVYGPEVLRLGPKDRLIRLVVFSSGPGTLDATLGGRALGAKRLRAGNNDIRYRLSGPAARVIAQRSSLLSLMSLSPEGERGAVVTRRVAVRRR